MIVLIPHFLHLIRPLQHYIILLRNQPITWHSIAVPMVMMPRGSRPRSVTSWRRKAGRPRPTVRDVVRLDTAYATECIVYAYVWSWTAEKTGVVITTVVVVVMVTVLGVMVIVVAVAMGAVGMVTICIAGGVFVLGGETAKCFDGAEKVYSEKCIFIFRI